MALVLKGGGSSTSDMFGDWETSVYTLDITELRESESTLYQNNDGTPKQQIEVQFVLADVADPQDGTLLKRKTWLSAYLSGPNPNAKTPRGRKGSQLWQLVKAASGVACVEDEEYDLKALLIGRSVRAIVKLNDKGYPSIDNDSFEPVKAKPAPAPARPLPPPPRKAVALAALRDEAQLNRLFVAGLALTEPLDAPALDAWAITSYGHGLDALTPEQCEELIAALGGPSF